MLIQRAILYSFNSIFFLILNLFTAHQFTPAKYIVLSTLILVHILSTQLLRRGHGESIRNEILINNNRSNSRMLYFILSIANLLYVLVYVASGLDYDYILTFIFFVILSSLTLISEFYHWEMRNFPESRNVLLTELLINSLALGSLIFSVFVFDSVNLVLVILILKNILVLSYIFKFWESRTSLPETMPVFSFEKQSRLFFAELGCMLTMIMGFIVMLNSANIALADYRLVYSILSPITFYIGLDRFVFGRNARKARFIVFSFSIFFGLCLSSFILFNTIQMRFFESYNDLPTKLIALVLLDICLVYLSSLLISIIPGRFQEAILFKSRIIWSFGFISILYPLSMTTKSIEIAALLALPTIMSFSNLIISQCLLSSTNHSNTQRVSYFSITLKKYRYRAENLIPKKFRIRLRYFKAKLLGKLDDEMFFLQRHLTDRRTFVDVGSNVGIYSYYYSNEFERVKCFDPYPDIHAFLEGLNAKNLEFYNVALSDYDGKGWLSTPVSRNLEVSSHSSLNDSHRSISIRYQVDIRRLDSYSFYDVDLIKIDTEGHEQQVISGARETISRCKPVLLVEIEQRYLDAPIHVVFESILSLGYEGFFLLRKELRPLSVFSLEEHQNTLIWDKDYIFNFIFAHKLHPLYSKFTDLALGRKL